jgi:hypothetical protein
MCICIVGRDRAVRRRCEALATGVIAGKMIAVRSAACAGRESRSFRYGKHTFAGSLLPSRVLIAGTEHRATREAMQLLVRAIGRGNSR